MENAKNDARANLNSFTGNLANLLGKHLMGSFFILLAKRGFNMDYLTHKLLLASPDFIKN